MNAKTIYTIARAVVRVLRDSSRTGEIHRVEELTGSQRIRAFLDAHQRSPEVQYMARQRLELSSESIDFDALRRLGPHTLGGAYVRHLEHNGLSADYQAAGTRFIEDEEIAYWMRRFRQTHDVWHALTGLGTAGHEEVLLHAFSWGQLRLPVSAMVVGFGTLKHIVLEHRWKTLYTSLRAAHRSGLEAAPLLPVPWERMWSDSLDEVRGRLRIQPLQ